MPAIFTPGGRMLETVNQTVDAIVIIYDAMKRLVRGEESYSNLKPVLRDALSIIKQLWDHNASRWVKFYFRVDYVPGQGCSAERKQAEEVSSEVIPILQLCCEMAEERVNRKLQENFTLHIGGDTPSITITAEED